MLADFQEMVKKLAHETPRRSESHRGKLCPPKCHVNDDTVLDFGMGHGVFMDKPVYVAFLLFESEELEGEIVAKFRHVGDRIQIFPRSSNGPSYNLVWKSH